MRATLQELCDKLGLDHVPMAYESVPLSLYDETKGMTASAEVRMGDNQAELDAEILAIHDLPPEDGLSVNVIMNMNVRPKQDGRWTPQSFMVKGEDYAAKIGNWEERACEFYNKICLCMKRGEMPDFEEMIGDILDSGNYDGRRGGGTSRKSPKIKPAQVLGIKQGGM